mmetsp:Transcript_89410/g.282954  ORF Transcript_89410/g.282954 Transcript_89410/m.282954 type:complete len:250 (-) Transcript_89410:64-813(-)
MSTVSSRLVQGPSSSGRERTARRGQHAGVEGRSTLRVGPRLPVRSVSPTVNFAPTTCSRGLGGGGSGGGSSTVGSASSSTASSCASWASWRCSSPVGSEAGSVAEKGLDRFCQSCRVSLSPASMRSRMEVKPRRASDVAIADAVTTCQATVFLVAAGLPRASPCSSGNKPATSGGNSAAAARVTSFLGTESGRTTVCSMIVVSTSFLDVGVCPGVEAARSCAVLKAMEVECANSRTAAVDVLIILRRKA